MPHDIMGNRNENLAARRERGVQRIVSSSVATFILTAHLGNVATVLSAQPGAARPLSNDPALRPAEAN